MPGSPRCLLVRRSMYLTHLALPRHADAYPGRSKRSVQPTSHTSYNIRPPTRHHCGRTMSGARMAFPSSLAVPFIPAISLRLLSDSISPFDLAPNWLICLIIGLFWVEPSREEGGSQRA